MPIIGTDGLKDDALFTKANLSGIELYVTFPATYEGAERQAFAKAYEEKFGSEPGVFSDYVHDNVIVLATAMQGCAETDTACVEKNLTRIDITGATGEIKFDADGDVIDKPYTLFEVKDGRFVATG